MQFPPIHPNIGLGLIGAISVFFGPISSNRVFEWAVKFTFTAAKTSILEFFFVSHIEEIMDGLNFVWTESSFGSILSSI